MERAQLQLVPCPHLVVGYVFPEDVNWPDERTTYTAAADSSPTGQSPSGVVSYEVGRSLVIGIPDLHTIGACTGKVVTIASFVAVPPAVWVLARSVGLSRRGAGFAAVATLVTEGEPGERFSRDEFLSSELSFPISDVAKIRALAQNRVGGAGETAMLGPERQCDQWEREPDPHRPPAERVTRPCEAVPRGCRGLRARRRESC